MPRVIEGRADWRGPELAESRAWMHHMSPAEVAEIDAALDHVRRRGLSFDTLTKDGFPLPGFASVIDTARNVLENGLGLYHIRGYPAGGRSKDDLRMIYWGLGKHLGTAVSQSKDGDLLGDVRDFGADIHSPQGRGYKSRQQLSYHTDSADVVGLMVLRTAKSGGLTKLDRARRRA